MQKYVSILPPEIKKRSIDEKKQGKLIRIILFVFVILLAVYAFLMVSSLFARSELQSLQQERKSVEEQAEALAEYEDLYNRMTEAEELINAAMRRSPNWGEFLGDIGRALDPEIALLEFSAAYNNEEDRFNMRGWTYTHRNVADMLDRVYTLEQLEDVRCRISTEATDEQRDAVEFDVGADILPGPQFFESEEGGN
ncbi:MAG: hypothetical protein R6U91_02930 [Bacillota bacterium]